MKIFNWFKRDKYFEKPKELTFESLSKKEQKELFTTLKMIQMLDLIHEDVAYFDVDNNFDSLMKNPEEVKRVIKSLLNWISDSYHLSHEATACCCRDKFSETFKKYKSIFESLGEM